MDMGDIVAGAWSHYRQRLGFWLALAAVAFVGTVAFSLLTSAADLPEEATGAELMDALPLIGGGLAIVLVADVLSQLSVIAGAAAVLRGEPLSVGAAYRTGLKRFLPGLLITAISAGVAGLLFATIILFPLAIFLFVRWSLALPALVVEGTGTFGSLGRSMQIVSGQWWRTFGIGVAIVLLSFLPGFIFDFAFGAAGNDLLAALGAGLATLVATPFAAIAHILLYADLRARKGERPFAAPVQGAV
jgi:hypothetical protein